VTGERELIARAVQLAGERNERGLASVLSPHFFARLASGRIVLGIPGFLEAVSYETVLSSPVRPAFENLEDLGAGFLLSPELDTARSGVRPGAWLLHIREDRITAALHFDSLATARRSVSPHVAPASATERPAPRA
jgi:hypothetical protein